MFQFDFYTAKPTAENENLVLPTVYTTDVGKFSLADGNATVLNLRSLTFRVDSIELRYICPLAIEQLLKQSQPERSRSIGNHTVESALQSGCDVIPGVVEGGFTVWDGSKQLLAYLVRRFSSSIFHGKRVLELGCGCGLPGIAALKCGASSVTLQDYNREVITNWTIPNVLLNSNPTEPQKTSLKFYSGDWLQLAHTWESEMEPKYDLILTAETIYRPDLYSRLLRAFTVALDKTGFVFLMCKAAYGPGGTLSDFLDLVDTEGLFRSEITELKEGGVVKFIVQFTWK